MNSHLSPEEFIDAIDGALAPPRRQHLDRCEACRQEAAALGTLARQVDAAVEVPEPSPLFWDHLSRRVSEATAGDVTSASGWWPMAWRPMLAGGAMVASAVVVMLMRAPEAPVTPRAEVPGSEPVETAAVVSRADLAGEQVAEGDPAWDVVVAMASGLSHEAVHNMLPSSPDVAVLPETMTVREREEFVKLVKQGMGGLE